MELARADLRGENARLVLGEPWWIADPLLQMGVYTIRVSVVFQRTIPLISLVPSASAAMIASVPRVHPESSVGLGH